MLGGAALSYRAYAAFHCSSRRCLATSSSVWETKREPTEPEEREGMSASIWKKTDQPRELDASAFHPPPPPVATAAPFLPVASLSSPLFVHVAFTVPEGSCMSQKTAGTSVSSSSLSHSQSPYRPSQIKTVVTVPRTSFYGGVWSSVR